MSSYEDYDYDQFMKDIEGVFQYEPPAAQTPLYFASEEGIENFVKWYTKVFGAPPTRKLVVWPGFST